MKQAYSVASPSGMATVLRQIFGRRSWWIFSMPAQLSHKVADLDDGFSEERGEVTLAVGCGAAAGEDANQAAVGINDGRAAEAGEVDRFFEFGVNDQSVCDGHFGRVTFLI